MPSRLGLILSVVLAFAGALPASIIPPNRQFSLEYWVFDADVIIRGRVIEIPPAQGIKLLRVQVTENIYGVLPPHSEALIESLALHVRRSPHQPWGRGEADVLFLLNFQDPQAAYGTAFPLDSSLLDEEEEAVYTMDFQRVRDPQRLLARVRELAKKLPATRPTQTRDRVSQFTAADGVIHLIVPQNELLLPHARQWVNSPNPHIRESGVKAMFDCFEPDIIPTATRLLSDPHSTVWGTSVWHRRHYTVRTAADELLRERGIEVPNSILSEPHFTPISLRHLLLALAIVAASAAAAVAIVLALRRLLHWQIGSWLAFTILLALVSTTGFILTWHRAHEFSFSNDGSTRFITLINGRLVTMHLSNFHDDPRLSHASYTFRDGLDARWRTPDTARRILAFLPGLMRDQGRTWNLAPFSVHNYSTLWLPLWPALLLCMLPLLLAVRGPIRRRVRRRRGLCTNCGFDLRASAGVCPECGEGA
jgi:hypothetical protein